MTPISIRFAAIHVLDMTKTAQVIQAYQPVATMTREAIQNTENEWNLFLSGMMGHDPDIREGRYVMLHTGQGELVFYAGPDRDAYIRRPAEEREEPEVADTPETQAVTAFEVQLLLERMLVGFDEDIDAIAQEDGGDV